MDTTELLKKVRKIEIKTKGLSNQIFSGEYNSAFKGRGMSFSEVREYQYGDDIRNIDWNVTARFKTPYVKIYEEERELTVMLLVDISESSYFGTRNMMKHELITELSAVLSFSAINNNDKIGVIFFSDKIEKFIPPKKGKSHTLRIIRELIALEANQSQTDIGNALRYFSNVIKKKSIAFLMSDFIDDEYAHAVDIASRRHDLIGVHVYDPSEQELPNVGLLKVRDAETNEMYWLDTSSRRIRENYAHDFAAKRQACQEAFRRCGSDLIDLRTDKPYVKALMNFFKKRGR